MCTDLISFILPITVFLVICIELLSCRSHNSFGGVRWLCVLGSCHHHHSHLDTKVKSLFCYQNKHGSTVLPLTESINLKLSSFMHNFINECCLLHQAIINQGLEGKKFGLKHTCGIISDLYK